MRVRDIMTSPVVSVSSSATVNEIASLMRDRGIGSVLVLDDSGKLVGIITEGNFLNIKGHIPFSVDLAPILIGVRKPTTEQFKKILSAGLSLKAHEIMSINVISTQEDEDLGALAHLMLEKDLKHVPVVRDGIPVGIVARHDILKALTQGI